MLVVPDRGNPVMNICLLLIMLVFFKYKSFSISNNDLLINLLLNIKSWRISEY